jgi:hypothetical protein
MLAYRLDHQSGRENHLNRFPIVITPHDKEMKMRYNCHCLYILQKIMTFFASFSYRNKNVRMYCDAKSSNQLDLFLSCGGSHAQYRCAQLLYHNHFYTGNLSWSLIFIFCSHMYHSFSFLLSQNHHQLLLLLCRYNNKKFLLCGLSSCAR